LERVQGGVHGALTNKRRGPVSNEDDEKSQEELC
jgi:hypothetical protein